MSDRQPGNCVICDRLGAWVSQQGAEEEINHLRGALAAWRPIVEAAIQQEAAYARLAQAWRQSSADVEDERQGAWHDATDATETAVRALPPEHRPDVIPLTRPAPAWSVAIDPDTPLVAPAKPFIPPSMLEPDDDTPEPPA